MKIVSYIHPKSTYLPCTGIGRHINQMLLGLEACQEISLQLLFSAQWLSAHHKLDERSPLSSIPFTTFPSTENATERTWKLLGFPQMDRYVSKDTDWLYAPMQTYIPISKCPVAITLHDIQAFETDLPWSHTWQHKLFRFKWSGWVNRALSDSRIIFTVSEFSKHRIVELLNVDPQKIIVVGNGVEPQFFDISTVDPNTLIRPIAEPYILVIGGLKFKKGADYVLSVARELKLHKSDLQILVAGDSESKYLGIEQELPNLKLLGIVPDQDLPRLLRCASSFLFLSHYEGFGIPAIEAMAVGTPAIVSNRASLPEIVGTAGIIVEPEQIKSVVDILIQLQENSHLREDYIRRGYQHSQYYTWARCVDVVRKAFYEYI
ncbi:glycosyltransferase family 4 protein [Pseudanabaena sp. UWO310]|uniref:glycosyltransferase family 4 protein n=1 Tax=Pseudanabaena sp. UWO310 TaxID=2480795 RepID=UPI0011575342|nr:glycosyltransferase family 1 protein [Pseudanabaena sp. UWO310]TYQ30265.1 glycosyltransferase family 4 protein [Pseudanabaena sp. UWO310]